ncbi:MAG: cyclodeaminase/cyclohydrolase family protein [Phycisphaerales bacterium]|nr:cyclodeaminase/cyclohydrolase family protein [Phycisphaerales bacterium]
MTTSPHDGLNAFLDALAGRTPTPGGGSAAAAVGALGCAMARMVAAYSPGKGAADDERRTVADLSQRLERADRLVRALIIEDERAYASLTEAARRLKTDPTHRRAHETARGVALAVPLQVAAAACESLHLMEQLLPVANRNLVSDLGVAAVLARASVRAAAYMVYVNAYELDDPEARQKIDHEIDALAARADASLARIETNLADRL